LDIELVEVRSRRCVLVHLPPESELKSRLTGFGTSEVVKEVEESREFFIGRGGVEDYERK